RRTRLPRRHPTGDLGPGARPLDAHGRPARSRRPPELRAARAPGRPRARLQRDLVARGCSGDALLEIRTVDPARPVAPAGDRPIVSDPTKPAIPRRDLTKLTRWHGQGSARLGPAPALHGVVTAAPAARGREN